MPLVVPKQAPWSSTEVDAVLAVRKALIETKDLAPVQIGEVELITVTLNSKLRVDEAVTKFMTYRNDLLGEYGIDDVWAEPSVDGMDQQWHRLAVAGRDEADRQIMWVQGTPQGTPIAEERPCIRACCQYCAYCSSLRCQCSARPALPRLPMQSSLTRSSSLVLAVFAVHADRNTLRNGISLVINTAGRTSKVGNERKLQVAWQNFPTRPQHIYICGTNMVMRVVINALIAFASLFAKNKVIARVKFANISDIEKTCGREALPEALGGQTRAPTGEWVRQRLADFPLMHLPEYV